MHTNIIHSVFRYKRFLSISLRTLLYLGPTTNACSPLVYHKAGCIRYFPVMARLIYSIPRSCHLAAHC